MISVLDGYKMLGRVMEAGSALADAAQSTLNDDSVRIAVTGLSRAGKTVFITSLIHNLLAIARGHQGALRCLYDSGITQRVVSASILPAATEAVARFPYAENLRAMAAIDPQWPPRTSDISQISLKLVMKREDGSIFRALGHREITLEILDYPGEWLLDLPLLEKSYAQWSRETLEAASKGIRAELSPAFLKFIWSLDPGQQADEKAAQQAHRLYKDYLITCKNHQLRFLQPGRFLCPGPWGDLPLLWFAPLRLKWDEINPGSLGALMAARFEAYKADMKAKFFEPYFGKFDRQIVLVDVLGALNAGQDVFEDTRKAIAEIASEFEHGSTLLPRIFAHKIDRVFFGSTKSDHVPEGSRAALQFLLRHLSGEATSDMSTKRVKLGFGTIALVRCTVDDYATLGGQPFAVVKGFIPGSTTPKMLFPGAIPSKPPTTEFWANGVFEIPRFQPPKLDPDGVAGIPHIDLDSALAFLVGDKL